MAVKHLASDYELLMLNENDAWLNAIKANDVEKVKAILESRGDQDKLRIVDGKFEARDIPQEAKHLACLNCSRSLTFAVIFNARDVLQLLLEHGADPNVKERNGDNIVHIIVRLCELDQQDEMIYVEFYQWLMTLLDATSKQQLLYSENHEKLRPLESASKKGYVELVKAILTTKEVYMVKEDETGGVVCQKIDISDYEGPSASRMDKSPLAFITMMPASALTHVGIRDTFTWVPFQQWYRLKLRSNLLSVYMWMIARMSLVLSYYVIVYGARGLAAQGLESTTNGTSQNPVCKVFAGVNISHHSILGLTYYITINAFLILTFDISEAIYTKVTKRPYAVYNCGHDGETIVSLKFYRLAQHIIAWVFAVVSTINLSATYGANSSGMGESVNILNLVAMGTSCVCVMYFLQMAPIIGLYVVTLQRMLGDLVNFMIFYGLIIVPFAFYFFVFFNTNSRAGCVEDFSDMWQSIYSTFTMMLNMVNLRDYDVEDLTILQIVHFVFVFIVAVLLVNFLIAVMSNSASEIADNERIIQKLERLHVIFILEFRVRWLLGPYYNHRARKLGFLKGKRTILNNVLWRSKFL